jgi:hypothetical protein
MSLLAVKSHLRREMEQWSIRVRQDFVHPGGKISRYHGSYGILSTDTLGHLKDKIYSHSQNLRPSVERHLNLLFKPNGRSKPLDLLDNMSFSDQGLADGSLILLVVLVSHLKLFLVTI